MEKRWLTMSELMGYLSVSRPTALKLARQAGARVKIGKVSRYDTEAIDRFMRSRAEAGQGAEILRIGAN